jgi:hypothetical protein
MKYVITGIALLFSIHAQAQTKRVFVTDSQSWQMSGGFSGGNRINGGWGVSGYSTGGARPQTVEIYRRPSRNSK